MRNQALLSWCAANGAGGLEFLSGIPGTLGGAAAVNAGAFGRSMADVLLGADIVDEQGRGARRGRRLLRLPLPRLALQARQRGPAGLAPGNSLPGTRRRSPGKSGTTWSTALKRHPSYRLASAGCFFKNPLSGGVKTSAGKLIEECGLKNTVLGDLAVAAEHANFLLNRGSGTFADLQRLEEKIRAAVAARTGIVLEREVIYVSEDGIKY